MMAVVSTSSSRPAQVLSVIVSPCSFMFPMVAYVWATSGISPRYRPVSHSITFLIVPGAWSAAGCE